MVNKVSKKLLFITPLVSACASSLYVRDVVGNSTNDITIISNRACYGRYSYQLSGSAPNIGEWSNMKFVCRQTIGSYGRVGINFSLSKNDDSPIAFEAFR